MVDRIRNIIARFPEDEDAIRDMIRKDRAFNALCQEYADTSNELERLGKLKNPEAVIQANGLRNRRVAIEEELLTTIEGYKPI